MSNFDIADLAVKAAGCSNNANIYDDKNMPSVMVFIPAFTWKEIGIGTSTELFPAFTINGKPISGFWFSKFQNSLDTNRAYSLPDRDPAVYITLDTAVDRCTAKGEGWHLQTRLEWMAVALWCMKNGTLPKGNNDYGKDHSETIYKAIESCARDDQGRRQRVATGTGPLSWSHNGEPDGIWERLGMGRRYPSRSRRAPGNLPRRRNIRQRRSGSRQQSGLRLAALVRHRRHHRQAHQA